jgi:hypothetical protein
MHHKMFLGVGLATALLVTISGARGQSNWTDGEVKVLFYTENGQVKKIIYDVRKGEWTGKAQKDMYAKLADIDMKVSLKTFYLRKDPLYQNGMPEALVLQQRINEAEKTFRKTIGFQFIKPIDVKPTIDGTTKPAGSSGRLVMDERAPKKGVQKGDKAWIGKWVLDGRPNQPLDILELNADHSGKRTLIQPHGARVDSWTFTWRLNGAEIILDFAADRTGPAYRMRYAVKNGRIDGVWEKEN